MDDLTFADFRARTAMDLTRDGFPTGQEPDWAVSAASALQVSGRNGQFQWRRPANGISEWIYIAQVADGFVIRAMAAAHEQLDSIEVSAGLPCSKTRCLELIEAEMADLAIGRILRSLLLELNVRRIRNELRGQTSEARFHDFLSLCSEASFKHTFFRRYPVLARDLVTRLSFHVDYHCEMLERLAKDRPLIERKLFNGNEVGDLRSVSSASGDSHGGGRTVRILTFASGHRVVYKPRSLSPDLYFQDLIEWLNGRCVVPDLKVPSVVCRDDYGWCEFVEHTICNDSNQVQRFYVRQGAQLALLYILEASDFHYENLIAAGEYPVLVDMEGIFHPQVHGVRLNATEASTDPAIIPRSVMRVGLLPHKTWTKSAEQGWDLSGIGGGKGQKSPFPALVVEGHGKENMRATRKTVEMPGARNRPSAEQGTGQIAQHVDAVVDGFESVCRCIVDHRMEFLAAAGLADGISSKVRNLRTRVVLRPTYEYGVLLEATTHPDYCQQGVDRDQLFDRLWRGTRNSPRLADVISAEQRALRVGDVPLFTINPAACHVVSQDGEMIPDFFERASAEVVRDRVLDISEQEIARQTWMIRASMATLGTHVQHSDQRRTKSLAEETSGPVGRSVHQRIARNLAEHVLKMAHESDDGLVWLGLFPSGSDVWSIKPLGLDLYSGTSGVLLFLAYSGVTLNEPTFLDHAAHGGRRLAGQMAQLLEVPDSSSVLRNFGLGGFNGFGGILYALVHLQATCRDSFDGEASEAIHGLLTKMDGLVEYDEQFDILGGCAGALLAALAAYHTLDITAALDLAIRCGDRLLDAAVTTDAGVGWIGGIEVTAPLIGFSHGTSGIIYALLSLAAVTGEGRFARTASSAIAYERSNFDSEAGNWPDFRVMPDSDQNEYMTAWCHGAPGVGLSRLLCSDLRDGSGDEAAAELAVAVETTIREGFDGSHCLCHGSLGNLDFLMTASEHVGRDDWVQAADNVRRRIVGDLAHRGPRCGAPMGIEDPGLMMGLSGIGMGVLRLMNRYQLPSVLTFDPPPLSRRTTG